MLATSSTLQEIALAADDLVKLRDRIKAAPLDSASETFKLEVLNDVDSMLRIMIEIAKKGGGEEPKEFQEQLECMDNFFAHLSSFTEALDPTVLNFFIMTELETEIELLRLGCQESELDERTSNAIQIFDDLPPAERDTVVRRCLLESVSIQGLLGSPQVVKAQEYMASKVSEAVKEAICRHLETLFGLNRDESTITTKQLCSVLDSRPPTDSRLFLSSLTGTVAIGLLRAAGSPLVPTSPEATSPHEGETYIHPSLVLTETVRIFDRKTFRILSQYAAADLTIRRRTSELAAVATSEIEDSVLRCMVSGDFTFYPMNALGLAFSEYFRNAVLKRREQAGAAPDTANSIADLWVLGRVLELRQDARPEFMSLLRSTLLRFSATSEMRQFQPYTSELFQEPLPALDSDLSKLLHPFERAAAAMHLLHWAFREATDQQADRKGQQLFDVEKANSLVQSLIRPLAGNLRRPLAQFCVAVLEQTLQNDSRFHGNLLQKVSHDIEKHINNPHGNRNGRGYDDDDDVDRNGESDRDKFLDHVDRMYQRGRIANSILSLLCELTDKETDKRHLAEIASRLEMLARMPGMNKLEVEVTTKRRTFKQFGVLSLLEDLVELIRSDLERGT